jgi:endonuclease III related protein
MLQPSLASTNGDYGAPAARDRELRRYYHRLLEEFGPQGWWPAETQLEVILGAILTQNTTWRNAALGIGRLREAGMLDLSRLRAIRTGRLQSLIRPAGFFKQKARTIQSFLRWLGDAHGGSIERMFDQPAERLREALLELRGLGPETVDAMLLYAGGKPFFVADAYTRRILARHGILPADANYHQAQQSIHRGLDRDSGVYNEFHALLVELGKRHCRLQAPQCGGCPLEEFLPERELRSGTTAV